eukprot:scaffold13258_cov78-Skeletonema_dohrnii-CCMP3373.AAC.1
MVVIGQNRSVRGRLGAWQSSFASYNHGQKAFNSTSHRYVIRSSSNSSFLILYNGSQFYMWVASHASSMCLRKAPAAGGSHGSGTGAPLSNVKTGHLALTRKVYGMFEVVRILSILRALCIQSCVRALR